MKLNGNYRNIEETYLFSTIAKKVRAYTEANPNAPLIRMGIGDVTLPLCDAVVDAMKKASEEMRHKETFRGYIPSEQGYDFVREAIVKYYAGHGVTLSDQEVFIGDGAKSDIGNILDLFSADNVVLIPDPVYPAYRDTNTMDGRKLVYMNANADNGFLPLPDPSIKADLIYICSPNNPTGAVYTHDMLQKWVDYANSQDAIILFDAAYEAFVSDESLPRSIFEIPGARTCAIEFCSLSKTAGFTGTRCGYTVVPAELEREGMKLNAMWMRRQTTKFNGVSYIVQRGAEAVFTPDGQKQTKAAIAYYMENARTIASTMKKLGIWYVGGENSPYIWLRCPDGMKSWDYFDLLLEKANIVGTPGAGFGSNGEGYLRLTAFNTHENTVEAMRRLEELSK
ncbi:MAG: LL-diaminopimelate aminotransferase [Oscillospiraceae bacterium]